MFTVIVQYNQTNKPTYMANYETLAEAQNDGLSNADTFDSITILFNGAPYQCADRYTHFEYIYI